MFIYNLPHSAKDFKTLNGDYLEGEKEKTRMKKGREEGEEEREGGRREKPSLVAT